MKTFLGLVVLFGCSFILNAVEQAQLDLEPMVRGLIYPAPLVIGIVANGIMRLNPYAAYGLGLVSAFVAYPKFMCGALASSTEFLKFFTSTMLA